MRKLIFVVLACLASPAALFKTQVHVLSTPSLSHFTCIVARIAYDTLEREDPKALKQANELLEILKIRSHGEHINKEGRYPFVECATLADDIKYIGGGWQSDWHFTDIPWFDQGGRPEDYPEFKADPKNLTSVIP